MVFVPYIVIDGQADVDQKSQLNEEMENGVIRNNQLTMIWRSGPMNCFVC